ncbi:MAG: hypothetical protein PF485_13065 [Bacteroidales bacterium]|jgi:hypothetical protein|nr:hypothetical protein [Bacteroidales bacterium]
MKKKLSVICFLLISITLYSQNEANRHVIGFSTGLGLPREDGMYIDYDQYNVWPDTKLSTVYNAFYEYKSSSYFKIGCHIEYENTKSEITYPFDEEIKAKRLVFGLHWIGQVPNYFIHLDLGGYLNLGSASSEDWDTNLNGVEFGIMGGPGIDFNNFGIALHYKPGFSYFFSGDSPEAVLLFSQRLMLRVQYYL